MTPQEVVHAFIAAIEAKDLDVALPLLAEHVSYENMPMDPILGRDATAAVLRSYLDAASSVEWRTLREIAVGNVVINERLDRFQIGDGWLELPVAGVWEVGDDGRISLWRDYFDMGSYVTQLATLTGG